LIFIQFLARNPNRRREKSQIPSSKSQENLKVSTKSYETTDNGDSANDEELMCSAVEARRQKMPNEPVVGQALRLPYNLFCAHIAATS
jgi:hypothetical protein